ncbi:16S rRNA (cytidine1402-2'-O)-methyltransferase [Hydrogenispora ethanolica]|uniref:Ribosomal RNA small subunit methyltransferase I n=1 Tax=Hydrogenispora ethanolica TaxID=1082276 RepID=A0A4R1S5Q0_HYDET|nr:16S rRNA (cytidine(1402)-2'-O)-methyltransferase [Hydrogenispora ethanolica]TCL74090.1 16S rRNA (cytidine1402-2'-O)-methyltransferase [Hydrogenispora ethanolica]
MTEEQTQAQTGTLYLVGTPLGNLEDITQRALRTLREVDLIAAEDTRHTLKLLNYFEIKRPLLSYHQHNERERADGIISRLRTGANVALVSDAGMPGISDPGQWLVAEAVRQGIRVVPVPGPSAVVTALAASGLDSSSFRFGGFLPRRKTEQLQQLERLKEFPGTLIWYEAPHRLVQTLKNIQAALGDRSIVLARELTKVHEQFIRGSISEVLAELERNGVKGEFTILVEGCLAPEIIRQDSTNPDLEEILNNLDNRNGSLRENLKAIARQTGRGTREIYQLYLQKKGKNKEEA